MWWQNTKNAAHQRRPVSDSTRGNLFAGELGGAPDSPGNALTGAPGGGVDASAAGAPGGCVWFSSAAFVMWLLRKCGDDTLGGVTVTVGHRAVPRGSGPGGQLR